MPANGWIKPSVSPYSSTVLFVQKNTRKLCICIEFRADDANTKLDIFPYLILLIFWINWAKPNTLEV